MQILYGLTTGDWILDDTVSDASRTVSCPSPTT